jgi:hypothetical protein
MESLAEVTELTPEALASLQADFPKPESKPEQLTRKQLGQLRRAHLTVQHGTVKACGHKAAFSKTKQPNNNCIHCWSAYFFTSVDLEGIHVVLTQSGAPALIKQRGTKFVKMFHGFLSAKLLPALAAEVSETIVEPAKIQGGTFGNGNQSSEIQTSGETERAAG